MPDLPHDLFNYRDLGGHRVPGGRLRCGVLFRSNAVVGLAPEVAERLGLRTALDLRERGEKQAEPATAGAAALHEVEVVAADPQVPYVLRPFTHWLVAARGHLLVDAVRVLVNEPLPAVMFCSSGKDRTGVLAAVIQSALGVDDETVVAEYAETERRLPEGYLELALERSRRAGLPVDQPLVEFGAPPDLMAAVLDGLRERHGGAAGYLSDHGLTVAELDRLRARLTA